MAFKSDETRHVTQNVFFTSPKKNQKMTKHVILQKQSYVIKKPKSVRKILQNKFKPIKNIKLQNICTKNPKKYRLGTSPA